jgi:phosphatidylinositol 3-kinase
MYKHDDLRKDQIVMNIINLMDIIVKKEEKLDLGIVTYNILPIDSESGIIEIVDDADTVYFIQEKIKSSILNYILEKNGNIKIKDLREKYIRSTAAYCVITYLLGIGDRHLDNIMVTRDGRLFHIDFGYILGRDPKFTNPSIRITPEIVEALGGFSSEYYPYFKELCTKIFNCLRRNIDIFMNLLLLLPEISDLDITEEEVKKQIYKRFLPGENSVDAQFHLVKKLEEHNITDRILDFCHYHSRERTINSTVDRVKFALSSLWNYTKKD